MTGSISPAQIVTESQSTTEPAKLERHIISHTQVEILRARREMFVCKKCLEEFSYAETLQRHVATKRCTRVDAATAKLIRARRDEETRKVILREATKKSKKKSKKK